MNLDISLNPQIKKQIFEYDVFSGDYYHQSFNNLEDAIKYINDNLKNLAHEEIANLKEKKRVSCYRDLFRIELNGITIFNK